MSITDLQSSIAQLPRSEKTELLRFLARELRQPSAPENGPKPAAVEVAPVDRTLWLEKLARLRELTASLSLRPSQEILDELREDRI